MYIYIMRISEIRIIIEIQIKEQKGKEKVRGRSDSQQ